MAAAVPAVEIADHADPLGIGRPDREQRPGDPGHLVRPGAQQAVGVAVPALAEQVEIEVGELRPVGVGVMGDVFAMIAVAPDEPVVLGQPRLPAPFEEVAVRDALEADVPLRDRHLLRPGVEHPDQFLAAVAMAPEHGEGIVVARLLDVQELRVESQVFHGGFPCVVVATIEGGLRSS
jgi:hypothetical protein